MAKKKISYSEAIAEIEETIMLIENEELDVDDLSEKVKRVSELLVICKAKLNNTEKEVEKILKEIDE
ncbi:MULTISPECIES: exodeoxyribonuclease VII small subunit [Marinifilum]|jgi:Exonuclease VII small subunit.|uniref:Exodeoxyribonuclease VII small subunit n=1 Tax=Marinifilum flexuosum TaxID=1117708 RepID=A0A419X814_9BACT|nr:MULTISPECIES: exodeoxyribonuclease VII small subunit [Marinifilum]MCY1633151.1 exodeoxyribonuclease VII small subunit [Marinifilum sp. D737]RKE03908.1 exodeoxyribonuclease VII small subunit [Marinifilum flexuosum]